MLKGTKLYSILFNKCPRCQEGDFFEKIMYSVGKNLIKYMLHTLSAGKNTRLNPAGFMSRPCT